VQNSLIRLNKTEVADIIEREYKDAAAVEQRFSSAADQTGVSHDWVTGEGDPADVLIHASTNQTSERGKESPAARRDISLINFCCASRR